MVAFTSGAYEIMVIEREQQKTLRRSRSYHLKSTAIKQCDRVRLPAVVVQNHRIIYRNRLAG